MWQSSKQFNFSALISFAVLQTMQFKIPFTSAVPMFKVFAIIGIIIFLELSPAQAFIWLMGMRLEYAWHKNLYASNEIWPMGPIFIGDALKSPSFVQWQIIAALGHTLYCDVMVDWTCRIDMPFGFFLVAS